MSEAGCAERPGRSGLRRRQVSVALILTVAMSGCRHYRPGEDARPGVSFDRAVIKVKGRAVIVEVANTPDRIARGLMYRDSLPRDEGMLFVYPVEQILSFWMRNTRIPLDIAFIQDDGTIAQIARMEPLSRRSCQSGRRARFALEMNRGWFEANGVEVGDRVEIPEEAAESAS